VVTIITLRVTIGVVIIALPVIIGVVIIIALPVIIGVVIIHYICGSCNDNNAASNNTLHVWKW
jgi:hypothetical protein